MFEMDLSDDSLHSEEERSTYILMRQKPYEFKINIDMKREAAQEMLQNIKEKLGAAYDETYDKDPSIIELRELSDTEQCYHPLFFLRFWQNPKKNSEISKI